MTRYCTLLFLAALPFAAIFGTACADGPAETGPAKNETGPLESLQDLVGGWKGVGQPERGSTRGAWTEQSDWRWDFTGKKPAILFAAPAGKHLVEGRITAGDAGKFHLEAKATDGKLRPFTGERDAEGTLTFTADKTDASAANSTESVPQRLTLRLRAEGARLVVLLERRTGGEQFARLAEVGYTRVGSNFGQGSGGPECVVTGGAGTMTVTYKGKTYYVCCTGCKDLFEAEPEKTLAEYEARKKKKLEAK
jgi:YHS domain-containing protein